MIEDVPYSSHGSPIMNGRCKHLPDPEEIIMNSNAQNRDPQSSSKPAEAVPAFKPVALPALAAAMCSAKHQPAKAKAQELPAILRKEAAIDR